MYQVLSSVLHTYCLILPAFPVGGYSHSHSEDEDTGSPEVISWLLSATESKVRCEALSEALEGRRQTPSLIEDCAVPA